MADPLVQGYLMHPGQTEEQRRLNEDVLRDLEAVMSAREGRRFVWRILGKSNLKQNAMTGNSMTYYLLGQQSVSNELIDVFFTERFLPLFRQMQDEAIADGKIKQEPKSKELKDDN
jgi:hypothetical protein